MHMKSLLITAGLQTINITFQWCHNLSLSSINLKLLEQYQYLLLLIEIIRAILFPFTCAFYLISSKHTTPQTQYYDESPTEITNIWGKIHDKLKILSDWTNE